MESLIINILVTQVFSDYQYPDSMVTILLLLLFFPLSSIETPKGYQPQRIAGFTVYVQDSLRTFYPDLCTRSLELVASQLFAINRAIALPPSTLRDIPIILSLTGVRAPCLEYHYSAEWLQSHGHDPLKAKAVEISKAENLDRWTRSYPWTLLHHLAYAYLDRLSAKKKQELERLFRRPFVRKKYREVLSFDGQRIASPATRSPIEYFATSSVAYWGTGQTYPFVRAELRMHDPQMFEFIEESWNPFANFIDSYAK